MVCAEKHGNSKQMHQPLSIRPTSNMPSRAAPIRGRAIMVDVLQAK